MEKVETSIAVLRAMHQASAARAAKGEDAPEALRASPAFKALVHAKRGG